MRNTKFRGKSVSNDKWVYGYLVPRSVLEEPHYLEELWIATGFENECYPVIKDSVGQFTGLLDWADKEIYEGDFCKDHNGEIGVIEWNDDTAGWCRNVNDGQDDNTYRNVDFTDFKVIGSTTDTPELLTV